MIQLNKNYTLPDRLADFIPIKIVSVGGAGLNALDRIVLDGLERADVVAINTDVQSLTSAVAPHKVQLGRSVTRGLGAGGDPELGYEAAVESAEEIRQALADARAIFVCAGLGGGTGSGATPYVAQLAREAGALVIAFVTLPFAFEGRRRNAQARYWRKTSPGLRAAMRGPSPVSSSRSRSVPYYAGSAQAPGSSTRDLLRISPGGT